MGHAELRDNTLDNMQKSIIVPSVNAILFFIARGKAMKKHIKISIFEISIIGIFLAIAITSRFFDKFIPHIHPLHIIILLSGIAILRVVSSFLFIGSYILLSDLLFGVEGPTLLAMVIHTIAAASLLLFCFIRMFRNKNWKIYYSAMVGLIILVMSIYLFLTVMGDSEYVRVSDSTKPFWTRAWMVLIFPGDWLNILVSTAISIGTVPLIYRVMNPISNKLQNNKF